jgi:hypothetical protein
MKKLLSTLLFTLINLFVFAAGGEISGKITDEKGETVMSATVMIEGTTQGARSDLDGKFTIKNVADGKYTLLITYVAYEKKTISDVVVKDGKSEFLNITITKSNKSLKEVVIKTAAKKESINALLIQQKNMATISDGISGEMIKKTADRNTSDVLKRVSGVTIVDNKFAVIRGLADRYNMAMLNGNILPSSESDRKAFSFDIFPSSLLDNIVISKAATPDKPGEFAGGIIDLSTKDIPNENFLSTQVGTGMNTIGTFESYKQGATSKTDWLGYDKTTRIVPSNFPTTEEFKAQTLTQKYETSKLFGNNWKINNENAMPLNRSIQVAGGINKKFGKESAIGIIAGLSYNRNLRTNYLERGDLNGTTAAYKYNDTIYRDNVLLGGIFNVGLKINNQHKINFKNALTANSDDQTIIREGDFIENAQFIKANASWFTNNRLIANQLNGEHVITNQKIKIFWGLGQNTIKRTTPDLRKFYTIKNYGEQNYVTYIPLGQASPFYSGTYFDETSEKIKNGNLDVLIPYKIAGIKQSVKVGAYVQKKDRIFDARVMGYKQGKNSAHDYSLDLLPQDQIFAPENMNAMGYVLDDLTQPNNSYTANSTLQAAYIMNDHSILEKFRIVYGVRVESFKQELVEGNLVKGDKKINKENTNILPSMNFTYLLNKKTNVRFCASQTLSRPEFRELASTPFFNFANLLTYQGNNLLEQTKIQNYDVRYEYFMGKGEIISGSVFYKYFDNPIESVMTPGAKAIKYQNAPNATCYGLEFEFRKSLSFLSSNEKSLVNNIALFGNFAYIKSNVNIESTVAGGEKVTYKRAMQGQSPYIINFGASFTQPEKNLGVNLVFNRIGERIFAVGDFDNVESMYEAARNVLDLQISKKFYNKLELKLSFSDILSNPTVFYYNTLKDNVVDRSNTTYQKNQDFNYSKQLNGKSIGLSVAYQF